MADPRALDATGLEDAASSALVGIKAGRVPAGGGELQETFRPLEIATDRCKGCGLCVAACPKHVLALDETTVNALGYHPLRLTDATSCTSCALCARVCPDVVFTVYARPRRN
jgi:2-oxoglutarate ferredoxin oxidoreductase subunit delta